MVSVSWITIVPSVAAIFSSARLISDSEARTSTGYGDGYTIGSWWWDSSSLRASIPFESRLHSKRGNTMGTCSPSTSSTSITGGGSWSCSCVPSTACSLALSSSASQIGDLSIPMHNDNGWMDVSMYFDVVGDGTLRLGSKQVWTRRWQGIFFKLLGLLRRTDRRCASAHRRGHGNFRKSCAGTCRMHVTCVGCSCASCTANCSLTLDAASSILSAFREPPQLLAGIGLALAWQRCNDASQPRK